MDARKLLLFTLLSVTINTYALPTLTEPNAAAVCDDGSPPSCANSAAGKPALCANGEAAFCRIWRWKNHFTTSSICINGAALCNRHAIDTPTQEEVVR